MTAALLTINRRAFASLRMHRNYRLYFLGQAISQSGTWIDKVAQAWLVLALTHSAFAVGLLAGTAGLLVRAAIQNGPAEEFQIEPGVGEFPAEELEQLRVRRPIAGVHVVHRIDDASPHEVRPYAIHQCPREKGILRTG